LNNLKWFLYFKDALGAIDGTHLAACPSAEERAAACNRKGFTTQNTLAGSSMYTRFLFVISGYDGSTTDGHMYHEAYQTSLRIPEGKYYLADGGFGSCDALMVPYRGVRYHLAEWGHAGVR
jgi:hypothetical protein